MRIYTNMWCLRIWRNHREAARGGERRREAEKGGDKRREAERSGEAERGGERRREAERGGERRREAREALKSPLRLSREKEIQRKEKRKGFHRWLQSSLISPEKTQRRRHNRHLARRVEERVGEIDVRVTGVRES
ncbi:hypothetical protein F2Q69_00011478 [Brassica cretica]|uniref:Uncharacterized protein n=1 Tax=Brassica cretica TaxID=69181 RepID=A0A8S9QK15_BRACR|nr:hypothetical protein F2Q69_00011478 [Brassica cretica]